MIDFLQLVNQSRPKIKIKPLAVVLIFIAATIITLFYSRGAAIWAGNYLPDNTVFYYEWVDSGLISRDLLLFDQTQANEHYQAITAVFGADIDDIQSLIWLRTADQPLVDKYLVQFSKDKRKQIKTLAGTNQAYHFYQPNNYTVWLSPEPLAADFSLNKNSNTFITGLNDSGLNIYWHLEQSPDFLRAISDYLAPAAAASDIKINIRSSQTGIKTTFFGLKSAAASDNLNTILLPSDADSLISLYQATSSAVTADFLKNIYSQLPQHGLVTTEGENYWWQDSVIAQRGEDWLIISSQPQSDIAIALSKNIRLKEENKTLPDGTAYVELVADKDSFSQSGQWGTITYWQQADVWGTTLDNHNYISNNGQWLEQVVTGRHNGWNLVEACGLESSATVTNLISFKTDQLKVSPLLDYLNQHSIKNPKIFSYQTDYGEALSLCW